MPEQEFVPMPSRVTLKRLHCSVAGCCDGATHHVEMETMPSFIFTTTSKPYCRSHALKIARQMRAREEEPHATKSTS